MKAENAVGFVLVFDNLTKLEKMQRMAAWREVARRIAHEIKNPLTPIQLSAQRLRRRYPEILTEKDSIFDQCTDTIIDQVDELKRLVSEFSQFARMPKVQKARDDLARLAKQTLILYQEPPTSISPSPAGNRCRFQSSVLTPSRSNAASSISWTMRLQFCRMAVQ